MTNVRSVPTSIAATKPKPAGKKQEQRYPLSRGVRIGVLVAVVATSALGALIAYSIARLDCAYTALNDCVAGAATDAARLACEPAVCATSGPLLWAIVGSIAGLIGSSIVAILAARSFGEWRMQKAMLQP